ncbi:MAG: hypothetical protein H0V17_31545 [Deltaproteobacteria bacterium]|nr:hypothetical protein [Deltaproteobacteria bacterium]
MRKLCLLLALGACASANDSEAPAKPAQEIVPGAARLRGGGVRMDVEVGRTFTQRPIRGGGVTAKPAAPVVR